MTSGGLAAVTSSFFAALYSAFGKYDVVHIHAEGPAFFSWLPKMFGKRVVVTIHGIDWQREKWQSGLGSKFIHQGEKNAVKYADEVIVLSKGVQDYFKETYGRKTHFIPNGVNRPQTREANLITDKFGLKKDSYILFLGRLVPEKGIRYLVEAFKNVKTDKKLVIAGGSSDTDSFMKELKELAKGDDRILFTGFVQGAMLDELYSNAYIYTLPSDLEGMDAMKEKASNLGIKDRVTFVGNVGNANEWYQAFDCFVLPSVWEGLPVVGVEAQAADLPCIFSSAVTREIGLSDRAKFIPLTEEISTWATEICNALQQNVRNDNTKLITEHHYNIEIEAKKLQERYLQLAGEVE